MEQEDNGELERLTTEIERLSCSLNALTHSDIAGYGLAALAVHYDRLADLYFERYKLSGDEEDLEQCYTSSTTAVEYGNHVDRNSSSPQLPVSQRYALQASRLGTKYDRFTESKDLDDAITAFQTAIAVSQEQQGLHSTLLINQANYLCLRYEAGGSSLDIENAIAKAKAALENFPSCKVTVHNDLSTMYFTRWERENRVADLGLAVAYADRAVKETDDDDPRLPTRLLNWSNGLCALYSADRRSDEIERDKTIKRAIAALEKAVYVCRAGQGALRVQGLTKLARAHHLRFAHLKMQEDIGAAISAAREAFKLYHAVLNLEDRPQIDMDLAEFLRICTQEAQLLSSSPRTPSRGRGPVGNPTTPATSTSPTQMQGRNRLKVVQMKIALP